MNAARAVADANPAEIEGAAVQLGSARRYLARIAWAAGALVLVVRLAAVLALYGLMLMCLVLIPARILGVTRQRVPPTEAVGRWAAGGALSAVAMTPGFVLDRTGLALLGVPGLHLVGFLILSAGVALYAAGLSSVKAVKLSMRLAPA